MAPAEAACELCPNKGGEQTDANDAEKHVDDLEQGQDVAVCTPAPAVVEEAKKAPAPVEAKPRLTMCDPSLRGIYIMLTSLVIMMGAVLAFLLTV